VVVVVVVVIFLQLGLHTCRAHRTDKHTGSVALAFTLSVYTPHVASGGTQPHALLPAGLHTCTFHRLVVPTVAYHSILAGYQQYRQVPSSV
jgi:hypothetical protein